MKQRHSLLKSPSVFTVNVALNCALWPTVKTWLHWIQRHSPEVSVGKRRAPRTPNHMLLYVMLSMFPLTQEIQVKCLLSLVSFITWVIKYTKAHKHWSSWSKFTFYTSDSRLLGALTYTRWNVYLMLGKEANGVWEISSIWPASRVAWHSDLWPLCL